MTTVNEFLAIFNTISLSNGNLFLSPLLFRSDRRPWVNESPGNRTLGLVHLKSKLEAMLLLLVWERTRVGFNFFRFLGFNVGPVADRGFDNGGGAILEKG